MNKLYLLSYFSSAICFTIAMFSFAVFFFGNNESMYLFITIAALFFPFLFYYYVTFPVIGKAWSTLKTIREKQDSLAKYFAVFGNMIGALIPFNIINRDMLVSLVD